MTTIGTPGSATATRVLLCGAGELGKEVAIELQRLGVEVVAVDRYGRAPAMQVAHRSHEISMLDGAALRAVVEHERPQLIVPEIEALATETLLELEADGYTVVPSARATRLTMDREGIRRLVAEELGLPTSAYAFARDAREYDQAMARIGLPFIVKPLMSSSGKGQSLVRTRAESEQAWQVAQASGRGRGGAVIVEGVVDFDYEITLLTVRHAGGTAFCPPVGHRQEQGDYRESWQPQAMSAAALRACERIAQAVTEALGGYGVFGVECFVKDDTVWFNEVSPRPHDTGMVTLVSQELSEFALHTRAILGLPIPEVHLWSPGASCVLHVEGDSQAMRFHGLDRALAEPGTQLRLFGKPVVAGQRRLGVGLARAADVDTARVKARRVIDGIDVEL